MNKFILGLDFDGVLALGSKVKIKYAKKWYDIKISPKECKEISFNNLMDKKGHPEIRYRELMNRIFKHYLNEYDVPSNCQKVLQKFHEEKFPIVVLSSRKAWEYPGALKYIKKSYSGLIKRFYNSAEKSKDEIVKKARPSIYIDDDLEKLRACTYLPVELVYFRQPENFHKHRSKEDKKRIHEVKNWDELYKAVHKLTKKRGLRYKEY